MNLVEVQFLGDLEIPRPVLGGIAVADADDETFRKALKAEAVPRIETDPLEGEAPPQIENPVLEGPVRPIFPAVEDPPPRDRLVPLVSSLNVAIPGDQFAPAGCNQAIVAAGSENQAAVFDHGWDDIDRDI